MVHMYWRRSDTNIRLAIPLAKREINYNPNYIGQEMGHIDRESLFKKSIKNTERNYFRKNIL